jgi:transcriptional regulator with XRE-family HTH domain
MANLLILTDGLGGRLKTARRDLGFSQTAMAELTKVSRATQVKYESAVTEPTTEYLRLAQEAGLDVAYVLYGIPQEQLLSNLLADTGEDWLLIQQAFEEVDLFLLKNALACPPRYRWKMVAQLFAILVVREKSGLTANADLPEPLQLVAKLWDALGKPC